MSSAIGTIASVQSAGAKPSAPLFADLITVVGDAAYPAGGTVGFLAAFQAAMGSSRTIVGVVDQSQPSTTSALEYDFTNDKLLARVRTTGVESAVTYRLLVLSK